MSVCVREYCVKMWTRHKHVHWTRVRQQWTTSTYASVTAGLSAPGGQHDTPPTSLGCERGLVSGVSLDYGSATGCLCISVGRVSAARARVYQHVCRRVYVCVPIRAA